MRKITKVLCLMFLASFFLSVTPVALADGPVSEPYKAIVKIRTFALDNQENLSDMGFGSGIIISSSGLLLTNNHVVEVLRNFDSSVMDSGYLVCLPTTMVDEPDCSYTAKLVAKDKNLDIALLQIENIPGLSSQTVFPYLELSASDTANVNDPVTAIGYPDIGGSTVTTTQGIISGKIDKYGKQWIKTDAVISFGSSGGAAINASNKVIGITSAGHSDLAGELGYIINIASVNSWITTNQNNERISSPIANQLAAYAVKSKSLNQSNIFENPSPRFTITKPDGWEFDYSTENDLYVNNPADEEGGDVYFSLLKQPSIVDINSIIPFLRRNSVKTGDYTLFKIQEDRNIKIGNTNGKKIRLSDKNGQTTMYAVPIRNYIMFVYYSYGLNDKDNGVVENIIQSLNVIKDTTPFNEVKKYTHQDPYFSFSVDKDWVMLKRNDKKNPLVILNKKYRDLYISIDVTKTDDTTKRMNHDGLLKNFRELIDTANRVGGTLDLKIEYTEFTAHYKTNMNFTDVIKGLAAIKTKSNDKVVVYEYGFTKKLNDSYILNVSMVSLNPDKKALATYRAEFTRLMKNFSITQAVAKKDTDKDGLNDDDEKKYGTNINKKDTDGDGYSDFEEVRNGYNPLGKGKLKKK